MRALVAFGGKSQSQYSQLGRSSKAMAGASLGGSRLLNRLAEKSHPRQDAFMKLSQGPA